MENQGDKERRDPKDNKEDQVEKLIYVVISSSNARLSHRKEISSQKVKRTTLGSFPVAVQPTCKLVEQLKRVLTSH